MSVKSGGPQVKSRIQKLRSQGSLKVVFSSTAPRLEGILVNTSGGLTSGDRMCVHAEVGDAAHLTLTTQAAERAYRAETECAEVTTQLTVGSRGCLHWLPQELILFDHAQLIRRLDVDLAIDARALIVEPLVFGRPAMGETVQNLLFRDRISIRRAGLPLYLDALSFKGNAQLTLQRPALGHGAGAMVSVIFVGPEAEGALQRLRQNMPPLGGASLLAEDVLAIRLLADDSFDLRRSLVPILDDLSGGTLPVSWRL